MDGLGPNPKDCIAVSFYEPEGDLRDARILIVIPGQQRNAEEYRDEWVAEARKANVLLLVPEFPADRYSSAEYNRGNVVDESGEFLPPDRWTFEIVEGLFDWAHREVASRQTGYYLYGHSAGAQFVQRFMLFMTDTEVLHAVSANPGWYTTPDPAVEFPYGLAGSPLSDDVRRLVSAPLTVMVGSEDNDPDAEGLRSTPEADEQGSTRFERAINFIEVGEQMAEQTDTQLVWDFEIVPGIAHSNEGMAPAAAAVMFASPGPGGEAAPLRTIGD